MVYRGRPSTGCKRCRERKIKCDERPGSCVKCIERGYACPGYDRTVDAFFHDETANVKAKAQKSKTKALASQSPPESTCSDLGVWAYADQSNMTWSPGTTLVDQGINFFITHHAIGMDQPPISSEAYHQHLSTDGFHPLVATAMAALGIAGVANLYMDSALKSEATKWYLKSIKMVNAAISSPTEVRKDTTLVAVNLLTMYEGTSNNESLQGWSSHVEGAAALVKLRGSKQFETAAGRRMYLHTIGLLAANFMGKGVPMPKYTHRLSEELMEYLDLGDPRHRFFFLQAKTTDLRAYIIKDPNGDLEEFINKALELDKKAKILFADAGPDWQYQIISQSDSVPGRFSDCYHVYPTYITAQAWNWVRYNRIYYHDIVRNCILAGHASSPPCLMEPKYSKLLQESAQTLQKLQADIIASMPQLLHDTPKFVHHHLSKMRGSQVSTPGFVSDNSAFTSGTSTPNLFTPPDTPGPTSTADPTSYTGQRKDLAKNFQAESMGFSNANIGPVLERLPIMRVSGGTSTLWSLYIAGSMPTATSSSQDLLLHILGRVETEFGIAQAKVLAGALRYKRQMPNQGENIFYICPPYLPPDPGENVPVRSAEGKVSEVHEGSDATGTPTPPTYFDDKFIGGSRFTLYDDVVTEIS